MTSYTSHDRATIPGGITTGGGSDDDWTEDSTDPSDDASTVSTLTSDSGSQLSDGLVVARKRCGFSHATTFGALSSVSVEGGHESGDGGAAREGWGVQ